MEDYTQEYLERMGKKLSFLLRHDKNYQFDKHGYREVSNLIDKQGFTFELLEEIVKINDKKRYEFSEGKTKIRARQGHSINVDVELKECTPPDILYHGTATRFIESIEDTGINDILLWNFEGLLQGCALQPHWRHPMALSLTQGDTAHTAS